MAALALKHVTNHQLALSEIDIRPRQPEQLPLTHTSSERQDVETVVRVQVLARRFKEPGHLLLREHMYIAPLRTWRRHAIAGVAGDKLLTHRLHEGAMQDAVGVHHALGR